MLIYLMHVDKIYTFKLPKKIQGNYVLSDYDSQGNKRSLVNVDAKDGKWYVSSNIDVKIQYNQKMVTSIELILYNFYQLTYGNENIIMYVCPGNETSYVAKAISNNQTLVIGNDSGCDITYNYAGFSKKQLELTYKDGKYSFKNLDNRYPVYLNKIRRESGYLENFDTLFIMGLKIVICDKFILVNNPMKLVVLMSNKFCELKTELSMGDYHVDNVIYKDFYDEKDYFNKSPVFLKKIKTLELEIALPPEKQRSDGESMLIKIVPSILMFSTSAFTGIQALINVQKDPSSLQSNLSSIIMCIALFISSIIWPFVEQMINKFRIAGANLRRGRRFSKYLKGKEKILKQAIDDQKMILCDRYTSLGEIQNIIFSKLPNLFSRTIESRDFLVVRLGIGTIPLDCEIDFQKPEYSENNDHLIENAEKIIENNKWVHDVPYTLSLYKNNILAFIGQIEIMPNYMKAIMLQLLTFHSYNDLKIVVLTGENENSSLSFLRGCNHCWNNEKSKRFFASNLNEGEELSSFLEKELMKRMEKEQKKELPYYLIVTDSISMYKDLKIIKDLDSNSSRYHMGLIMFCQKVAEVPSTCNHFVDYKLKEAASFNSEMDQDSLNKFNPEFIEDINFNECIRRISNIPIKLQDAISGNLPDNLGFLELYGIGNVKQFNSIEKWKNSDVINSLSAPIGVDVNGNVLNLDLHEKRHGPHGLVAGMTGSGKSEFIVTYILSLAVNYSPDEVQFVLIDYKGGGLAGAFENRKTGMKLPHLVGTITNLDKSEMKRTLVSIKSELQRRQRVFNLAKERLNTGTIDIYKYQRLVRENQLQEPMSHLFIICDEFAELKAQQPDFMDELVSAARIGRSLGIHLILATQKPSGVVDDQIWSNSKFKVCCKVQTVEDSKEMIRRDDAAYLKQSGRFYLQVGYDEYFVLGQSAYSGITYIPSERSRTKIDDSIDFLNNSGEVVKNVTKPEGKVEIHEELGEELGNVLKYLIEQAAVLNFQNKQLWLENVAPIIYLEDIRKKYEIGIKRYNINPVIGEYDDPRNQKQGSVTLPINQLGNIFIMGVPGSGKSTLLSTIIYSAIITHNTSEVNFYIVDLLAETLNRFIKAPQVGDFVTTSTPDKIKKLFYFLTRENEKRKRYYSDKIGGFEGELKKEKTTFPSTIVIINGMDVFKEEFEFEYEELFGPLTRECNRNGIYFIVTGTSLSSLGFMVENNFSEKIVMRLLDKTDYNTIFPSSNIIPAENPGRGLIKLDDVYEFQTALIFNDAVMENNLNYVFEQLNKFIKNRAKKIPVMPKIVSIDSIRGEITDLSGVPIGIEFNSACPYLYDFDNFINLILFENSTVDKTFITQLSNILIQSIDYKLVILDAYNILEDFNHTNIKLYNSNFKKLISSLIMNIEKSIANNSNNQLLFLINGYTELEKHLNELKQEDNHVHNITDLILSAKDSGNYKFIIADQNRSLRSLDNPWGAYADNTNGILLGLSVDDQSVLVAKPRYDLEGQILSDTAMVVKDGEQEFIKYVRR